MAPHDRRRPVGAEHPPTVVISLDFELRWGLHDVLGFDMAAYRENLEKVREVVPALLRLFSQHGVRATWATVGAIGCHDWDEYFRLAPPPPKYHNERFRFPARFAELDPNGYLHFAPDLVRAIAATPGQEVGTHTFSHLYCQEPGNTADDFRQDLLVASALSRQLTGSAPVSLVFPRNQANFLEVLGECGIRIWRGPERPWYFRQTASVSRGFVARALGLADSLNPFIRRSNPLEGNMSRQSLFLRLNLPDAAWRLHFARVRHEVQAMQPGEIFHLWWHPHNLGKEMARRVARVEQVLDIMAGKRSRGALRFASMGDFVGEGSGPDPE